MSIVEPAQIDVVVLKVVISSKNGTWPGTAGKFSGEVEGLVTSQPYFGWGTRKSRKNSALPLRTG
jgi:hypothetical protein